jgi:hypothetical protein
LKNKNNLLIKFRQAKREVLPEIVRVLADDFLGVYVRTVCGSGRFNIIRLSI